MSVQSQIDRINQNVANTYAVLDALGAEMPSEQNSDNLAATAGTTKAVLYSEQTLTEEEKAQARRNIGVVDEEKVEVEFSADLSIVGFVRSSNGTFSTSASGLRTDYVPMDGVIKIFGNAGFSLDCATIAFYDADKTFISGIIIDDLINSGLSYSEGSFELDVSGEAYADAAYFVVSTYRNADPNYVYTQTFDDDYCKFIRLVDSDDVEKPVYRISQNTIVFFGDSITSGTANGDYPSLIASITGAAVTNHGKSGATLATDTSSTYHIVDLVNEYSGNDDIICVSGGLNDMNQAVPMGTLTAGYEDELDTTTFIGALESIFRKLLTSHTTSKIYYVITHKGASAETIQNSLGLTFTDYHDAIVEVLEKYSIPFYDAFADSGFVTSVHSAWGETMRNLYTVNGDGIHPNEAGYLKYYVYPIIAMMEHGHSSGRPGKDGEPGASPNITLSDFSDSTGSGVQIEVRNPDGTGVSYPVYHGRNGTSAFVSVTKTGNVATITTQDASGKKTVDVLDGAPGEQGETGYTPIRGVDYYTDADKSEFSEYIASELAKRGQLAPEFANSTEECTDTSKMYVLPDGFIYAYTLTETEGGAGYTNLVPTSIDTDGTIYNGTGYKDNVRLSSSGGVSSTAQTGSVTTGFMPFTPGCTIRIKDVEFIGVFDKYDCHCYMNFFDATKTLKLAASEGIITGNVGSCFEANYDEESGITTVRLLTGVDSDYGRKVDASSFFRINAYGKGSDLIVTVNEEIEETGPSISYAWESTGHAFVPADYEDRIVALEEESAENKETVADLKQQVDDILDGTTEIAASTKFDPTVYRLPVLHLTGDTAPIAVSKDNKVTLSYVYGDRSGTCTLKGQGATSYKTAQALVNAGKAGKFNYTIKFDTAFEAKEGWGEQQKYCLKANFIDTTHSRNIVSCILWGMSVKSRSVVPTELAGLPNGGAIDGFPIIIMLNGEFHGLYTWNIPKDGWMFGMVEDTTKTQAIVGADDHTTATQFKEASMTGFEVEFVSDEDNAAWVETSLTRLISAVMNSDGSDLDTTVAQYLDWDSVIDHYIHTVVDKAMDCVDKNYLLATFDGVKWYMSAYDRDSIHGLNWDASGTTRPVSNISFVDCAETVRVYELIKRFKTNALKARYKELRGNILSESRIMEKFENFAWAIPSPVMLEDVKLYPTILGSGVNTIDQIGRFVRQRLARCDEWIDALPVQEIV